MVSQTGDLHLDLRVRSGRGVRAALTEALRDAARSGRLGPGSVLPSSRVLSADLGLARATVVEAYETLAAEGWLVARPGAVTRVAPALPGHGEPVVVPTAAEDRPTRIDLRPGRPDLAAFPRTAWWQAVRKALAAAPDDAFGYDEPAGRPELRVALADHLARVRGVRAHPGQIVVTAGATDGLRLLAGALRAGGASRIALEDHGLHVHRRLLEARAWTTTPLPVDAGGARTTALDAGADVALLTPAHQFPTGVPLEPARRTAAVGWARATDGLVVEDDYDGEFRYDRRPVGALQGLDPDRVAYLGTASKALAPGIRLGWLAVPPGLVDAVRDRVTGGPSVVDQLALTELLRTGAYDRHLRAARRVYRRRREDLTALVADRAPQLEVVGHAAGLHVLVRLPAGAEPAVLAEAARRGIALEGLATFRHPRAGRSPDGVVVGYAGPSAAGWSRALAALGDLLATTSGPVGA